MVVTEIVLNYVCPSLGCLMAALVFAGALILFEAYREATVACSLRSPLTSLVRGTAPIQDLRRALARRSLGSLNPFPWVMMTGNCLGWVVYGYYQRDIFVVVANVPGLVLSIWLNSGASKLQYYERCLGHQVGVTRDTSRLQSMEQWDAAVDDDGENVASVSTDAGSRSLARSDVDSLIMVPQEVYLMRMLITWAIIILWAGWVSAADPARTIGVVVNINLIFFYGAPLQTIKTVISTKNSESIHRPTVAMCTLNTLFWSAYGLAQHNGIIILPNATGLVLSLLQSLLIAMYPSKYRRSEHEPLPQHEDEAEFVAQDRRRPQVTNEVV